MMEKEKKYKLPAIVWLKMTDYTHEWLQYELGGSLRIREQLVLSIQHIKGMREALRMETSEDLMDCVHVGNSMSATWKNCIDAGLDLDPDAVRQMYGITKDSLKLFVPVECPRMCLTKNGVLRPWTPLVNFGQKQAAAIQKLLRQEFWSAVEEFDREYANKLCGKHYPAVDMIENFCQHTKTPDLYVFAMRREWQRRVKRNAG